MRFAGFIGPSYQSQSLNVDAQTCKNLFPEINPLGTGKEGEVASLVPTPGLDLLLTLLEGPVRGLFLGSNGVLYAVGGTKLYSISVAWSATQLGTLISWTGPVSMADNGDQLVIVDGQYGYSWDMNTSTFSQITSADFNSADTVTHLDGYFILNWVDTQKFYYSGIREVTFDALDFGTVEGSPDNLIGLIAAKQNIYMFGEKSLEVYYNSGDADNPFQRVQGAVIEIGCPSAPYTISKMTDSVYWLGADTSGQGVVYRISGFQYEKISTPAVDSAINAVDPTTLVNARAWSYQQGGHWFYCLNVPGINSTWVFDASTSFWHERTYHSDTGIERHRADCHAVFNGKNVVGDYESGKIYSLDGSTYTDNGAEIIRERAAPHVAKNSKRFFHNSFQLDMEVGVGADSGADGNDPVAILQWSDDGGHTWSDELFRNIGKIGERKKRVLWNRLGSSRDRVYRVRISDPVKVVLIGAELNVSEGLN